MPAEGFTSLTDHDRIFTATVCGRQVQLRRRQNPLMLSETIEAVVVASLADGQSLHEARVLRTVSAQEIAMAQHSGSAYRALWVVLHEDIRQAFGWSDPDILATIQTAHLLPGDTVTVPLLHLPAGVGSASVKVRRDPDGLRAYADIMTGSDGMSGLFMGDILLATRPPEATSVKIMRQHIEAAALGIAARELAARQPTKRQPKAPEPEPVVRPVGRLYDLDD